MKFVSQASLVKLPQMSSLTEDVSGHPSQVRWDMDMGLHAMGLSTPANVITLIIMTDLFPGPAGQADPLPGWGHLHQSCC